MKKKLTLLLMAIQLFVFAQTSLPKDIIFDKTFFEAENNYVMLQPKETNKDIFIGVPYFDSSAGFSFRLLGSYSVADKSVELSKSSAMMLVRWQNLKSKAAIVPPNLVKEWKLPEITSFLENYKSKKSEKELQVDKLSFVNGAGFYDIALLGLEKLHAENYKSEKFYFELAFSYNALGKFALAESTVNEAEKNGYKSELFVKEKHYSLIHQNKLAEAAAYLQSNFSTFKSKSYLSESIINQMATYYKANDFSNTEKWIEVYKKEIGNDQYLKTVEAIQNSIKQQNSNIK